MTGDKTGAGGWDAAITAIVVGAVIALVVYLVESYGKDMEKISTVLGVVVPVLTAAFGAILGYNGGSMMGKATARKREHGESPTPWSPT